MYYFTLVWMEKCNLINQSKMKFWLKWIKSFHSNRIKFFNNKKIRWLNSNGKFNEQKRYESPMSNLLLNKRILGSTAWKTWHLLILKQLFYVWGNISVELIVYAHKNNYWIFQILVVDQSLRKCIYNDFLLQ